MPLTFPSHAAAILPFCRRYPSLLSPVALVVGSCAPDLAYLFDTRRTNFHLFPNFILFAVPSALLLYLWAEKLLLPCLRDTAPTWGGVEWARFAQTRGLPDTPRKWLLAVGAVVLGGLTHVLWDGFTHHTRWPASQLYPGSTVSLLGHTALWSQVLQAFSHLLGLGLVALFLRKRYPALPGARAPHPEAFAALAAATMFGVVGGLGCEWLQGTPATHPLYGVLWELFWSGTRWGMVSLTLACLAWRWRAALISLARRRGF
jgi:Domain of unknown function (DUF4184)